jgi:site-specific recombinase XerC
LGIAAKQKSPATAEIVGAVLGAMGTRTIDLRDKALLALGFAAALRRSELVALDVEDVEFVPEGMRVCIRRSKTDQAGAGSEIAVPLGKFIFPAAILRAWLDHSGVTSGSIFRRVTRGGRITAERLDGRTVASVVKQRLAAVGLCSSQYSGHSLRARFVTSACAANCNLFRIADVTCHKQLATLKLYDRKVKAFENCAGDAFL